MWSYRCWVEFFSHALPVSEGLPLFSCWLSLLCASCGGWRAQLKIAQRCQTYCAPHRHEPGPVVSVINPHAKPLTPDRSLTVGPTYTPTGPTGGGKHDDNNTSFGHLRFYKQRKTITIKDDSGGHWNPASSMVQFIPKVCGGSSRGSCLSQKITNGSFSPNTFAILVSRWWPGSAWWEQALKRLLLVVVAPAFISFFKHLKL